jgi:EAL domain-containing protein (putative c-di-GMP-specific phosphodiesterase class I)
MTGWDAGAWQQVTSSSKSATMDLEYEPQVAGDGSLRGFEAFARWQVADTGPGEPERGLSTGSIGC